MKGLQTHKKVGFKQSSLHIKREPHPVSFLKQRTSFWLATLSLLTFVVGNMMGQHGWYGFWASVLGEENNTAIAYQGTTLPFENVVDYECWARFGGDYKVHNFRQAPKECLEPMPSYTSSENRNEVFSMQFMSSYQKTTEGTGTHAGIDIRVPVGTPVRAVMNGRVLSAGNQSRGFGKYVVIEHPNVPNPDDPHGDTVTLFTTYAHLDAYYVSAGDIVHVGDTIALSGDTGNVTGPHLHFSMERESAPYYPYFPSTMSDGYKYSVNPLLYVQSDYHPVDHGTVLVADSREETTPERPNQAAAPTPEPESIKTVIARLQSRREARLQERLALLDTPRPATSSLTTGLVAVERPTTVVQAEETVRETSAGIVDSVEISHDGSFSRGWEKVTIRLIDEDGNTVTAPRLDTDLYLRTEFGEAEFRPAVLSPLDFFKGEATVNVLPRGRRTLVIKVMPFGVISKPLQYVKN